MKRLTPYITTLFALLSVFQTVRAQIPSKFNYQAIVRGNAGTVIASKPLGLRFSIRDGSATGAVQYSETQLTTTNAYGLVNVQVGAGTVGTGSFAVITWASGNKFLQVEIDTTGSANYVSLATVELISVPYALQAQQAAQSQQASHAAAADSAGKSARAVVADSAGRSASAKVADSAGRSATSKVADSAVASGKASLADSARAANAATTATTANSANTAVNFSGSLAGDVAGTQNATVIQNNAVTAAKISTGQVVKSINGLKDNVTLTVGGGNTLSSTGNNITITGAPGTITGVNSPVSGTSGLSGGGTSGNVNLSVIYAGSGSTSAAARSDHNHVGQLWTSASGNTLTLQTSSASFNSSALEADVVNTSSLGAAIFAQTLSTNANSAGIVGQASGNGGAAGVLGIGLGNGTYAIEGSAQGAGSYAGVFGGNVIVTGTLSKGAGSFKIDHPLDPANKYLSHSFVESPDMMNIYNGNILLDGNGGATVTLPDWFEALNRDFRYQLTAMGRPSPNLYIAEEISGNQFRIAGGTPGARVSWMVTGIRHDAYANAHRIPVEEVKTAAERGKYLNPEVFGRPRSQGVYPMPNVQPRHSQPVPIQPGAGAPPTQQVQQPAPQTRTLQPANTKTK